MNENLLVSGDATRKNALPDPFIQGAKNAIKKKCVQNWKIYGTNKTSEIRDAF